jgi:hypothetical protein
MTWGFGDEMGIEKWSRGMRLTVYAIGGVLTVAFMIAYVSGITYLMASCEERSLCSNEERSLVELAGLALLAAIVFPFNRLLKRALRIREDSELASMPEQTDTSKVQLTIRGESLLAFGQSRIAGRVNKVEANRHCLTVGELRLRFWGGYALRNGWIRTGDQAAFVYQRLLGLNFVLAFWKAGKATLRGVGGVIHSFYIALAAAGVALGFVLGEGRPVWLIPVCIVMFSVSSIYLLLQFFAKRSLRDFIGSSRAS